MLATKKVEEVLNHPAESQTKVTAGGPTGETRLTRPDDDGELVYGTGLYTIFMSRWDGEPVLQQIYYS